MAPVAGAFFVAPAAAAAGPVPVRRAGPLALAHRINPKACKTSKASKGMWFGRDWRQAPAHLRAVARCLETARRTLAASSHHTVEAKAGWIKELTRTAGALGRWVGIQCGWSVYTGTPGGTRAYALKFQHEVTGGLAMLGTSCVCPACVDRAGEPTPVDVRVAELAAQATAVVQIYVTGMEATAATEAVEVAVARANAAVVAYAAAVAAPAVDHRDLDALAMETAAPGSV